MINLKPVTSLDLYGVKRNFETLQRNAEALQHPTTLTYLTAAPALADLQELQSVYALIAGTMWRYSKVNGTLYKIQMTAA